MKCDKYQSSDIIEGSLVGYAGVVFRPKGEEKKLTV